MLCAPLRAAGPPTMVLGGFAMHRISGGDQKSVGWVLSSVMIPLSVGLDYRVGENLRERVKYARNDLSLGWWVHNFGCRQFSQEKELWSRAGV